MGIKYNELVTALVKNYGYKRPRLRRHPDIHHIYPETVEDGNKEDPACYLGGTKSLFEENVVQEELKGKDLAYTTDRKNILELDNIAKRLGLDELLNEDFSSFFVPQPVLYIALTSPKDFNAYIIKTFKTGDNAWFLLTDEENEQFYETLRQKVETSRNGNSFSIKNLLPRKRRKRLSGTP